MNGIMCFLLSLVYSSPNSFSYFSVRDFARGPRFANVQTAKRSPAGDHVIRNLRKPGDTKHYIPRKGFYKYVTSANYFGELTEWIGYAILTWSPAGALFAVWTFANLGPRAKSLTEKYEKEFGEAYTKLNKKHIIPFIW